MLSRRSVLGTVAYLGGIASLSEEFCWAWSQMVLYNAETLVGPGEQIHYDRAKISFHSTARNSLASTFLGDWLVMLDADHAPDPDIVARMLRSARELRADVLTALYMYRWPPHAPVLYRFNGTCYEIIGDWTPGTAIAVDSAGAGCLLVRRGVFDRIRAELGEEPFQVTPPFSEDHSFFARCRRLGIKAWCDPRIECPHLTTKAISLNDFDRAGVEMGKTFEIEARR